MKVLFTIEAEGNVEAIADYIALDNPERAASFARELRLKALDIGNFPEAFPIVGRYQMHQVRRRVFGNYLILYRIARNRVEVLQVVHGANSPEVWRF